MHYLLFYELASDYLEKRQEFRKEHLSLAWQSSERGELILGGALSDPTDFSILMFKGNSPIVAEMFAASDPYVLNGLVKNWYIRPWTTVVGELADTPVKL